MNPLLRWLTSPEWAHTVTALLHSLWQGALVALALALLMRRLTNPLIRYRCALSALGVIVVAGLITWGILNAPATTPTAISPAANDLATAPAAPEGFSLNPGSKAVVIAPMTRPTAQTNWTTWLALIWMSGAMVMLLRAGIKVAGAEKLRRSCQPLADENIAALVVEACRAIGLVRKIRVAVTDKLTSPAVVGVLVPTLILPLSLFTTLTQTQIQFVLLHELAHIRRGDYLANLFQLFAEALLFFNPAVWWISHQIRREREACCDALAIELSGAPADYAKTLVRVAENILQPAPAAAPAFGDDGREPSSLADRVQRLVVPGYRPSLRLTWRAILTSLIVGGTLLVLSAIGTRNTVGAILTSSQPTTSPVLLGPGINPDVQSRASGDDSNIQTTRIPILTEFVGYDLATAATFVPTPITGAGHSTDSILPLPIFRVRQLTTSDNAEDGQNNKLGGLHSDNVAKTKDKVPFLGDLPGIGKLFTSESSAERHTWFAGDDSFSTSNWTVDGQQQANQQWFWYRTGGTTYATQVATTNATLVGNRSVEISGRSVSDDASAAIVTATNGGRAKFANQEVAADFIRVNHTTGEILARGNVRLESTNGIYTATELTWQTRSNLIKGTSLKFLASERNLKSRVLEEANMSEKTSPLTNSFNRLNEIRLENIYFQRLSLREVIGELEEQTKQSDPEKLGVSFRIESQPGLIDPATGLPIGTTTDELDSVLVTFRYRTSAPLKTILDQVVSSASSPIKYAFTNNIVRFSMRGANESEPLFTREFTLPARTFYGKILTNLTQAEFNRVASSNQASVVMEGFRAWLGGTGVNMDPKQGKALFYLDQKGVLLARATLAELDAIETVVMSLNEPATALATRTFNVGLQKLAEAIEAAAPQFKPVTPTNVTAGVRALFQSAGVDLALPKSIYYNGRSGGLFVRATKEDLDTIESLLNVLGRQPAQVNIKVYWVEMPQAPGNSGLLPAPTNAPPLPIFRTNQLFGILTKLQMAEMLRRMEMRDGLELLNEGQVTTQTERPAQLKVSEMKTIVTGINPNALTKPGVSATNLIEAQNTLLGPVINIIPTVSSDETKISLRTIATVTEFLGYEKSTKKVPVYVDGKKTTTGFPRPKYRIQQMTNDCVIPDGETLVLGGPTITEVTTTADGKVLNTDVTASKTNHLFVFITATIIDSAGNPAKKDMGIPSRLIPDNP